ncbi:MAG TPA: DUF4112 domain-containing protein [Vicinamibacterales bacterium]
MSVDRDQRSLELLRRWARLFDAAFRIPGTEFRFGLDPLIGLFPGIGDLTTPLLTMFILWHAARLRVPKVVLARMVLNALIDAGVGAIPILGDAFDFAWRANEWNMALLERHAMPGRSARSADYLFVSLCGLVVILAALLPIAVLVLLYHWIHVALAPR